MITIKIPELPALSTPSQLPTDVYEMSPAVGVPGSSRKETRQQISDYITNQISFDSIYASGNTINYTTGTPLAFNIPDSSTELFAVQNQQNGADLNQISKTTYSGLDQVGSPFDYHEDCIKYRGDSSSPSTIQSMVREFYNLEAGVKTLYLDIDSGALSINAYKEFNFLVDPVIKKNTISVPGLDFNLNANVTIPTTEILRIRSISKASNGDVKSYNFADVDVITTASGNYTTSTVLASISADVEKPFLVHAGNVTNMIDSVTGVLAQNATLPNLEPIGTLNAVADGTIQTGDLLTYSSSTDFRVVAIPSAASLSTPVIGYALESKVAGETINIGGALLMVMKLESGESTNRGGFLTKSTVDDGAVKQGAANTFTVGVAAQATSFSTVSVWKMINNSI